MSQFGEAAPLGIIEAQSPPFEPRLEDAVLFTQERDDVALLVSKPTAQRCDQELEGNTPKSTSAALDPVWGQYGLRRRLGVHFLARRVKKTRDRALSKAQVRVYARFSRQSSSGSLITSSLPTVLGLSVLIVPISVRGSAPGLSSHLNGHGSGGASTSNSGHGLPDAFIL